MIKKSRLVNNASPENAVEISIVEIIDVNPTPTINESSNSIGLNFDDAVEILGIAMRISG